MLGGTEYYAGSCMAAEWNTQPAWHWSTCIIMPKQLLTSPSVELFVISTSWLVLILIRSCRKIITIKLSATWLGHNDHRILQLNICKEKNCRATENQKNFSSWEPLKHAHFAVRKECIEQEIGETWVMVHPCGLFCLCQWTDQAATQSTRRTFRSWEFGG